MKITLKLHAMLRDHLPAPAGLDNAVQIEVASGTTPAQVIARYNIPEQMAHLVMVDGKHLLPDEVRTRVLQEGEVLSVVPPIMGG